ncbi:MAG: oxidoreductase [Frankiales bacterium]|nr:oxidoreductase [Frankiales bacterium]
MLIDAKTVPVGSLFERDVCVVGAGPAGIAMARRMAAAGLTVALLESGGFTPELSSQRLYSGDNVGRDYFRLDGCRFRQFGGSTNRWGGWCRPLDAADFEERPWVPDSGWPIGISAIEPYFEETSRLFDIPSAEFELDYWQERLPPRWAFGDESDFSSEVFQYSPQTNFGEKFRDEIVGNPAITTFLHANVTELTLDQGTARVGSVQVATLTGAGFTVRAKVFVLATGGLENPRLLLQSRADRPNGLGNEHDVVGRYFMEHLHVPAGHLVSPDGSLKSDFYWRATRNGVKTRGVLTPTVAAQERYGLPTCSIAIENSTYVFGTPYVGWHPNLVLTSVLAFRAMARAGSPLLSRKAQGLAEVAYNNQKKAVTSIKSRRAAAASAELRPATPGQELHSLYFRTEQGPNAASRVRLSERKTDALGMPRIELDWQVTQTDLDVVTRWLQHLDASARSAKLGVVIPAAEGWQDGIIGGPHHMGTTRMSSDPRRGVVDADCKVHSVKNLYVAGSSVFATGGYTNPSFTLVALALRLADHLRDQLA